MRKSQGSFKPYLNPAGAWALAFGCSIGWGAFLIPATFLPTSGVLGSIIGIAIGVVIMLIIARNYHMMICQLPKAGGAFTFATRILGPDHGFLCAWFLCLTYVGLIWANISAFALLARYALGDFFQTHHLYSVAGFEIYLEEVILCLGALLLAGAICLYRKKLAQYAQMLFSFVLAGGLIIIFALVLNAHPSNVSITPLFVPGTNPFFQVMGIITVIPWAYVGFESISHSAEEFAFSPTKSFLIMACAIGMAALAYVFMILISVLALPEGYPDWVAYINDLDSFSGIASVPTFSAIHLALGDTGMKLLTVTMLGALFSSLVGNIICASRLICVMAEEEIFPTRLGKIDDDGIPRNAILFIVGISLFIPFLGRTAIGWNVDITNIGATIAYGYTSIATFKCSQATGEKTSRVFGIIGIVLAVFFLVLMLLPVNMLAQESYLIFTGWIILGFLLNYRSFKKDQEHRYGRSTIVWVALFLLSIYTSVSFVWQSSVTNMEATTEAIEAHYSQTAEITATEPMGSGTASNADALTGSYGASSAAITSTDGFVSEAMGGFHLTEMRNYIITIAIILLSFRILLGNYSILRRREAEGQIELGEAQAKAYTDKLTGVKSINAYRERENEINALIQSGEMTEFALAICDVNNVKEVNDRYGHQAGDEFIRKGCREICNVFKHSPVYRIGGDEFVVILERSDFTNRENLLQEFEALNNAHRTSGEIIIAVGIADWLPEKDDNLASVFARADIFMYKRKSELKSM